MKTAAHCDSTNLQALARCSGYKKLRRSKKPLMKHRDCEVGNSGHLLHPLHALRNLEANSIPPEAAKHATLSTV